MLPIRTEQFEGPLDLLLQLIEQEKLDITSVSLAAVTEQYLEKVSNLSQGGAHLEELADFLVVAAKLLLLKARMLLPNIKEDDGETQTLERQLTLYREFVRAAKFLERMYANEGVAFFRPGSFLDGKGIFSPPKTISTQLLRHVFTELVYHIELPSSVPKNIAFDSRISIQDKMRALQELLTSRAHMYFRAVFTSTASKTDVIVSFLALLELIKQRLVCAEQNGVFTEISIQRSREFSNNPPS